MSEEVQDEREELARLCLSSTYDFAVFVCRFKLFDPDLHGAMSEWVERPSRFKLGLAPRGHFKTSCWTIANTLREITANPNLRVLVCNEIADNAEKWIGMMQRIVLSETYRALYPDRVPNPLQVRWNTTQLELRRTENLPEPTVESCGVGKASTSNHYDLIINDDLMSLSARYSEAVRKEALDHRALCRSLMNDASESRVYDFCTRWHEDDYAAWDMERVNGLDIFKLGVYGQDEEGRSLTSGKPIFPKRCGEKEIQEAKVELGPELFALQYFNEVVGGGATKLDTNLLCYFDFDRDEDNQTVLKLEKREGKQVSHKRVLLSDCYVFQTIDAGLTKESEHARTANFVAAITPPTNTEPFDIVVLECKLTHSDPPQVIEEAWKSCQIWKPLAAGIEVFGGHITFYHWIMSTYPEMPIRTLPTDTTRSKNTRIMEFWPTYMRQRRIYVHRQQHVELIAEVAAFDGGLTVDGLDAGAYLPKIWGIPPQVKEGKKRPPGVTDFDLADDLDDMDFVGPGAGGRSRVTGYAILLPLLGFFGVFH